MYSELKYWIAQSASWQSYIDFKLPKDVIANYQFLERYDDFYISLLSNAYNILEEGNIEDKKEDLFEIAKGLEIYSLNIKKDYFTGIDFYKNVLYSASFYYLADYSASAVLLSKLFQIENYHSEIDYFIAGFLRRENVSNTYSDILNGYIVSGDYELLEILDNILDSKVSESIKNNNLNYLSFLLAKKLIERFKVNNIWVDLLKYNEIGFWQGFVNSKVRKEIPIWDFFPSQRDAILAGILSHNQTISMQMPTSAGKTAICELIIYNEFRNNPNCKILYLAPFRALASELKISLGNSLRSLGIKVKSIYGGNMPTQEEKVAIESSNLLIATPEKFMAIEEIDPLLIEDFTTIICDEGHLIDDSNRGLSYELLLTRLKSNKRFVFISAIIPNIETINNWLGGNSDGIIKSKYRPTKLEFAFLSRSRSDDGYLLDINPTFQIPVNYKLNKFIQDNEYSFLNINTGRRNKYTLSEKSISATTALKSLPSGSVALFATSKGKRTGVQGLVNELIKQITRKLEFPNPIEYSDIAHLGKLVEYFTYIFNSEYALTNSARHGFLFHTGDLPQFVREVVEDSIRSNKVKLVVCTNTLAEGVNLPLKTIVLYSITRKYYNNSTENWTSKYINLRDLKNLVGRAGRAGKETKGLIIAINVADFEYLKKLINDTEIEDVKGFLYNLIENINGQIEKHHIDLTNELFEKQNENFLRMIDLIDTSIIHLLDADLPVEKVDETINKLLDSTLSAHQSNKNELQVLKKIFYLRSQKVKPFIDSDRFIKLKSIGVTIREYNQYEKYIDLESSIIQTLENPVDDKWIEYIFDNTIFKFTSVLNVIEEYEISLEELKTTILLWIQGGWYGTISAQYNGDVDKTLNIINRLISYNIQSTLSSIIKYIELHCIENGIEISHCILKFPQYLLYGTSSNTVLDLIEIGFGDRVSNLALGNLIDSEIKYSERMDLKNYLIEFRIKILETIKTVIPELSYDMLLENYKTLRH